MPGFIWEIVLVRMNLCNLLFMSVAMRMMMNWELLYVRECSGEDKL